MTIFEEYMLPMHLPCGGTAYYCEEAVFGHRCDQCGAVVGSTGQSTRCKEEEAKYNLLKKLGGKGWDYTNGEIEK